MPNAIQSSSRLRLATTSISGRRYGSTDPRTGFRDRSVLPPREQPTVTSEDGARTLRTRQDGNHSLPLPPIMDPIAIEAIGRHKQLKPLPDLDNMTAFQVELEGNPYAHALSGEIRRCTYTGARLPVHFLQRFCAKFSPSSSSEDRIEAKIVHKEGSIAELIRNEDGASLSPSSAYVLNSQALLRELNAKSRWATLVTERMRQSFDARAAGRKADSNRKWAKQWKHDADLPELVLSSLRRDVVGAFHGLAEVDDGGRYIRRIAEPSEGGNSARQESCGEPAAPTILYELQTLLEAEDLELVKAKLGHLVSELNVVALEGRPQTVKLQLALQKLSSFVGGNRDP